MVKGLKASGSVSTSNYFYLNGSNENLTLINGDFSLGENATFSLGVGNNCFTDFKTTKNTPAFQAKFKYNINEKLNTYVRFQEIGGKKTYRLAFGGNHPLDKNNSVYWTVLGTASDNHGEWGAKTGACLGFNHKFKNGISLSGEVQQNIPLNNTTKSFGQTLGSFNDSDKMVSVFLTVPLFKK